MLFTISQTNHFYIQPQLLFLKICPVGVTVVLIIFHPHFGAGNKQMHLFISGFKTLHAKRLPLLFTSLTAITAEIFLSLLPCAMARMFTPFLPSAANILPAIPVWLFILSPTTAITAKSFSTISGSTFWFQFHNSKALSTACFVVAAFAASTATQIECSLLLCVIRITLASASNKRLLKPGMPTMPLPSFQTQQTNFINTADATYRAAILAASFCITCAFIFRRKSILHPHGNIFIHYRLYGWRVNYFSTKVAQLHRFLGN